MKIVMVFIILSLLFTSGCIVDRYSHSWVDTLGIKHTLKFETKRGMTTTKGKDIIVYLPDGFFFYAGDIQTISDPNAVRAIGDMIFKATSSPLLLPLKLIP